MEIGRVAELDSRLSETNFTKGSFQLRLQPDGNLVLNTRNLVANNAYGAYYSSDTNDDANPGQKLIYDESGHTYILRKNGSRSDLYTPKTTASAQDYYQRATLNFNGVLSWYRISRSPSVGKDWSPIKTVPDNICMTLPTPKPEVGSGTCGYNSICTLGNDQRPSCECPQHYSLIDPNDKYGSCKPDFKLDDYEGHATHAINGGCTLMVYPDTDWPNNDYERLDPSSEKDCKNSCLSDCFCVAAMYRDMTMGENSGCCKKKGPLVNGRRDPKVDGTGWLKVKNNVNYSDDSIDSFVPPTKVKIKHNHSSIGWLCIRKC